MRGAGGAGVPTPGEPRPFPPVLFPAPRRWRWHIWVPMPARRVTLAESLLHCGPQFSHLYRGGEPGQGESKKSGISGAAPERKDAPTRGSYFSGLRGGSGPRVPTRKHLGDPDSQG